MDLNVFAAETRHIDAHAVAIIAAKDESNVKDLVKALDAAGWLDLDWSNPKITQLPLQYSGEPKILETFYSAYPLA
jgi:hypothetical protein